MRLPFIQCDDAPNGRVRFISPDSVGSIVAYPENEKGCFVITFIDKDGQGSASKPFRMFTMNRNLGIG